VLFDWQYRFVLFTFDERRIRKGAGHMGLDAEMFDRCMGGDEVENVLDMARSEFDRRGLSGTPSFFINGEKVRDYREFESLGQLADELSRTP
jgi:2-hydroxychromene-2-carboxylate isomerase